MFLTYVSKLINIDVLCLRMAPSVPESQLTLPQLFTELQKFVHKNDLKNIVKFSNLILHAKGGQNDVDALKCKSIALIEMEKFGECIKALQEGKFHAFRFFDTFHSRRLKTQQCRNRDKSLFWYLHRVLLNHLKFFRLIKWVVSENERNRELIKSRRRFCF